jgi:hypothetical protein
MIPLGSCTMKLNATSEMLPVTWPEFARIHPFAPANQIAGYLELFSQLERWLAEITGFSAVSLQPNAGSQGEYAGLLVIRAYHESRGEKHRTVCLIPESAPRHEPASAVIAGFSVVPIKTDSHGSIDLADLKQKAEQHREKLACLMITYPSTRGVFEEKREGHLPDHSRQRRAGVHGRREHERPGGRLPAWRHRRGCLPPQPAQDLLHPPRAAAGRAWARSVSRRNSRRFFPGIPV